MIWRLHPFAVFAGLIAGSAAAVALGLLGGLVAVFAGVEDIPAALLARADVAGAVIVLASASSFVAGYTTARFSPGEEIVNAATSGAIFLVAGAGEYAQPSVVALPSWLVVLSLALVVPCALLGGLLLRDREPTV